MIGKEQIAEAMRYADAIIEEHGDFGAFWRKHDVDADGLVYVAMQRALRVIMMEKGLNPNVQHPTAVRLTGKDQAQQMKYASVFMDGFAAAASLRPPPTTE